MTTLAAEPLGQPALPDSAADAVYRKVAVRLIPLLFLCYIAAYLDRVNVGFAKLQMQQALQLSDVRLRLRRGHLLHRLLHLRDPQQRDAAQGRRRAAGSRASWSRGPCCRRR